jgi:hypothetical protein
LPYLVATPEEYLVVTPEEYLVVTPEELRTALESARCVAAPAAPGNGAD